jgi:hypothetical protein
MVRVLARKVFPREVRSAKPIRFEDKKMVRIYAGRTLYTIKIKDRLFAMDKGDASQCLSVRSLGTAAALGLLAVFFPAHLGTVDQFVVKALAQVSELPEWNLIACMNLESLNIVEGTVLNRITRRKAEDLTHALSTSDWTPRRWAWSYEPARDEPRKSTPNPGWCLFSRRAHLSIPL